jgi:CSLREA domain-containing protein
MRLLALLLAVVTIMLAWTATASAATFVVTATDDINDGTCDGPHCSLREAIHAANANPSLDQIRFNSAATITPAAQLPEFIAPVLINANPGTGRCSVDAAPLRLSGGDVPFSGLVFAPGSDGSIVCLATIGGFGTGIELHSDGNAVKFSHIGTNSSGFAPQPNAFAGISITGADNVIGGGTALDSNLISGNAMAGVMVAQGTGNRIAGNLIGLDALGAISLPNGDGVIVTSVAKDTIVDGNVISGNLHHGVDAAAGRIIGNHIGVTRAGTVAIGNGAAGVHASGPVEIGGRTDAERNVISANALEEVRLSAAATVVGNRIGLNAFGEPLIEYDSAAQVGVKLAAGADGARLEANVIAEHEIEVETAAAVRAPVIEENLIGLAPNGRARRESGTGIRIGEATTGARIIGNTVNGKALRADALGIAVAGDDTRIEGNTVGLDVDGEGDSGIGLNAAGIAILGTAEGTAMVSNTVGDHTIGIELLEGSAGTVVESNFIGTDPVGTVARPNEVGILISGENRIPARPVDVRIRRNVISSNEDAGVATGEPAAADAIIEGNSIGVGADGITPLGNGEGISVGELFTAAPVAPVPAPGHGIVVAGNRIAHNDGDGFDTDGDGIEVGHTTTGVTIRGNEIFANSGLGIDFGDRGVSANGSERPDVLPPFPQLTSVAGTSVQGTIDLPAGHRVRVDLFASATCDPSGHGEGQTPIGALTLAAPGGVAAFSTRVDAAAGQPVVTATATDLDTNRTSEFSRCALPGATTPPAPEEPSTGEPPATIDPPGPIVTQPGPLGIDVPPRVPCIVPNVAGVSLAKAKTRLTRANCGVGKVTKPKRRPGKRYRLVVKRASHKTGATRPAGSAVGLTLVWKRIR